jgi:peptide/nickel transport system substrate-binding protein
MLPVAVLASNPVVAQPATPANGNILPAIMIEVAGGPDNLDPALTRSVRDWSILHALYDSLLDLSEDGELRPLAADSFESIDDLIFEVVLRSGMTFHDGTPVTSEAIRRSIAWVQNSEGPAAGNFGVIDRVDIVDDLTARIVTTHPAPWLPSQLAVWMVLFPEGMTTEAFQTHPVGSGPYQFVSQVPGSEIVLERNPTYPGDSAKGTALAELVTYRVVPEATTRVADLVTGAAQIVDGLGLEHIQAVTEGGGQAIESPVLGVAFLRLVNDTPPFDDPLVRQAINHAIDVESIGRALVSPNIRHLPSLFPDERSIGFDPDLAPLSFDPDLARQFLADAGYPDGFAATLQYTGGGSADVMLAIAANLADVGLDISVEATELASFNGTWQDPDAGQLRFVSWRPVYDPHTLLSLMFASTGPLSRFSDDEVDRLIVTGGEEVDGATRQATYEDLGRYFQVSPPAVFLWNLTSTYGVRDGGLRWTPRGDEYMLPMHRDS